MDKTPARSKGIKILKLLQKPASFSVSNPKSIHNNKGFFSGPLVPPEARRRDFADRSFDAREPSSPKVSCIGQIKHKKANRSRRASGRPPPPRKEKEKKPKKSSSFGLQKMFSRRVGPGRRPDVAGERPAPAPAVGDLRRFRSGREALAGFDWRKAMEEEEEEEVLVPFSAPILIGGGATAAEPKKEVNLWKRRTMDPPGPLVVNT